MAYDPRVPSTLDVALRAATTSIATTYALYPYRDYIKQASATWPPTLPTSAFVTARYRGLAENPLQLLLLSSLQTGLLVGFYAVGGGALGAMVGGACHALGKTSMRMLATRMAMKKRSGDMRFESVGSCIRACSAESGVLSWFSGFGATAIVSMAWHGAALTALQQRRSNDWHRGGASTFFGDWWYAFRAHAFLAFVTCPLRNTFRSSLYAAERSGGVQSVAAWARGEQAIFREAAGVAQSMVRTQGIRFFLDGSFRVVLKTSLPFGFTFATFRLLGGRLP